MTSVTVTNNIWLENPGMSHTSFVMCCGNSKQVSLGKPGNKKRVKLYSAALVSNLCDKILEEPLTTSLVCRMPLYTLPKTNIAHDKWCWETTFLWGPGLVSRGSVFGRIWGDSTKNRNRTDLGKKILWGTRLAKISSTNLESKGWLYTTAYTSQNISKYLSWEIKPC